MICVLGASAGLPAPARAQQLPGDTPADAAAAATQPASGPQLASFGKGKVLLLLAGEQRIPSLAQELVDEARKLGQPLQASSLALEDLQVAVGCADASVACLQRIGKSVAAAGLLVAETNKVADQVEVSLRLFHIATGGDKARATVLLPLDPPARQPAVARVVARLFRVPIAASQPTGPPVGSLGISASEPDVEITIEGQPRGALPLDLRDVPVGTYRLVVDHAGFYPWRGTATVKANRSTRVHIELIPTPRPHPSPSFFGSIRLPTWIIGGAGLVSLGVAAIFGGHMLAEQNSFDSSPAETPDDLRHMESLRESGRRDATAANVFLGIGGAALITATVLAIIDYRKSHEDPAPGSATADREGSRAQVRVHATGIGLHF
jgi:hypothetical protein